MLRLRRRSLILAAFVTTLATPSFAQAAGTADTCVAASEGVGAAALIGAGVLYFTKKNSDSGIAVTPLLNGGAMAQGRISF